MKKKVLIVDDEVDILDVYESFLSEYDIDLVTIDNGNNAINLIRRHEFDVVITDYSMPSVANGLDVALAAAKKKVPKIAICTAVPEIVARYGFTVIPKGDGLGKLVEYIMGDEYVSKKIA